ncbi:MAG: ClcB-like voltage-gated chloride channel protein [Verrucomicrobia bacterium]|nr:ClcB-like voltage-gated chloride channel protein [Verrucomicrobiota bacterium]
MRAWVLFSELVRPSELQVTLLWAGLIGFLGALVSVGFRDLVQWLHWILTQNTGSLVESFTRLSPWQRLLIPALGGALAGVTLYFGNRIKPGRSTTDYMEAIVLGDGVISSRLTLVKCTSALFSIASGASIGREGPLVQLSAMIASLLGRMRKLSMVRLRLLVACGAAAGIASAYNAPIGGALFVSEIILRSLAMESFGPLVFASVIATLTVRQLLGASPLYEISIPAVQLNSTWEIALYLLLGALAGGIAPLFLWSLRASETLFKKLPGPGALRLAVGGLAVGGLAVFLPEVCGNGYSVVNQVIQGHYVWYMLLLILIFKLVATAVTFGSGAVGGVFTPTLFVGACMGYLFALGAAPLWPGAPLVPTAFTLVGMGALLAATTHAPLMAILVLFEMTLDYQIILPLMLACVVAHYVSRGFNPKSIYAESLKRKGEGIFDAAFPSLRVADLMKPKPESVREAAPFLEIAESFLRNQFVNLYVVDANHSFKGVISLHDIKSYLSDQQLANLVIARDLLRTGFPTITPDATLAHALTAFAHHDADRLPVISNEMERQLIGTISKSDLLLALAEQNKQEEPM